MPEMSEDDKKMAKFIKRTAQSFGLAFMVSFDVALQEEADTKAGQKRVEEAWGEAADKLIAAMMEAD